MKRLLSGLLLSCVLMALTGCGGIAGTWKLDTIEPESAKANFDFGMLCLAKDGTYAACVDYGGGAKCLKGTYTYDDDSNLLTFKTSQGKERAYKACLCGTSGKLFVCSADEGKVWKAAMTRFKCSGKCPGDCGGTCLSECGSAKGCCPPSKCDPKKCSGGTT